MNKDMLAFLKGMLTVAVLLLLSTPLILMNVFEGDLSEPWIGFWGSFAGGILGTAGVIYVAHIQSEQQRELNRDMIIEQRDIHKEQLQTQLEIFEKEDRSIRERMKLQNDLDLLRGYLKDLEKTENTLYDLQGIVENYSMYKPGIVEYNKMDWKAPDGSLHQSLIEQSTKYILDATIELNKYHDYFLLNLFSTLTYKNVTIKFEGYKEARKYDRSHVSNIADTILKIKLDNIKSDNTFKDIGTTLESFNKLIEWTQLEITTTHMNIKSISDKLLK